ncbi:carbohydrate ABC transporter permease [Cutibacterium sp. V947]|uniref:carbohydrate ABC transporter permease n=1 Tax=Cutibacterium sp. V947 TaxID=3446480 RepID=UPI003EE409D1
MRRNTTPSRGAPGEPRRVAWLYLLPGFLIYAAFLLYPLIRSVQISLYDWDGITLGTWAGLGNYRAIFSDEKLGVAFVHSAVLIIFFALIPLVIGLVVAAIIDRGRIRGIPFFRTVIFVPQVVAMVAIGVAWRHIFEPDGPLNVALRAIGLGVATKAWLGDRGWALPSVGIVGMWVEIGLVTVLMLAGMSSIPREQYEAARLDGAGPIQEFLSVTLPSVRPQIAVSLTMTVIAALKTFDLVYVMTKGGPGYSTTVPSYQVYHQAFELGRVGQAAAVGVFLTLIIFVISVGVQRIGKEG